MAAANEQVKSHEQALRDVTSSWRAMDDVVPAAMFEEALEEIPFEEPEELEAPVEERSAVAFRLALLRKSRTSWDALSVIACIAAWVGPFALFYLDLQLACVAVGIIPASVWLIMRERVRSRLDKTVELEAAATFPQHWQDELAAYTSNLANRKSERDAAWSKWSKEEQERVSWLRSLIAGHPGAVEETLSETLSDLDFPFETSCRVAVPTSSDGYVLLDLPEIEDVIPELKPKILKSGTVKMVKRTAAERHEDYAHLAAGLALMVGRTALNASPTLERIHIAGFTQRRNSRSGQVQDEYVYEASLDRSALEYMNPAAIDPFAFIVAKGARLVKNSNGSLKKITEPEWLEVEQFNAYAEQN